MGLTRIARILVPVASALLLPLGAGASAQAAPAPAGPAVAGRVETVTCPGLGSIEIALLSGESTSPLPDGVTVSVGYQAIDARTGAKVTGGPPAGGTQCAPVKFTGLVAAQVSAAPPPAGVAPDDRLTGAWVVSVNVQPVVGDAPRLASQAPSSFVAELQSYLSNRGGTASVAVFDSTSGATYTVAPQNRYVTASIVKADILATLLRRAQDAGRGLTGGEQATATQMIEVSDNNAATALWNEVGGGPGVAQFNSRIPLPNTTPGSGGLWGLTRTTAPDQVELVKHIAYPNPVLGDGQRAYEQGLMEQVTSSQRWGVSGGVPSGVRVALKNGWLPVSGGWEVNSIGHVFGGGRDYVIAVLTVGDPTMGYGITTIQGISSIVWSKLPAGAAAQKPAVVPQIVGPAVGSLSAYLVGADGGLSTTWQNQVGGTWHPRQAIGGPAPGGGLAGSVTAIMAPAGTFAGSISAYTLARDGRLYTTWQTQIGGLWNAFQPIGGAAPGGGLKESPAVVLATTGTFAGTYAAYAEAADGRLYTTWQTQIGGLWAGWQPIGGAAPGGGLRGTPAMVLATTGTLAGTNAAYAETADGRLYTTWQTQIGGLWAGWQPIGGAAPGGGLRGGPVVLRTGPLSSAYQAYAAAADGLLYTTRQTQAGGLWTGWQAIGGAAPGGGLRGSPAVVMASTGFLSGTNAAYAEAADGQLYTTWQTQVGGGWAGWAGIAGPPPPGALTGTPTAVEATSGAQSLYAMGSDNRLYTTWQIQQGGTWAAWAQIG